MSSNNNKVWVAESTIYSNAWHVSEYEVASESKRRITVKDTWGKRYLDKETYPIFRTRQEAYSHAINATQDRIREMQRQLANLTDEANQQQDEDN